MKLRSSPRNMSQCKDVGAKWKAEHSSEVSSAFFIHPTIASTPVPEGVTVRFSPTAVDGYVWGHSSQLHQNIMQMIMQIISAVSSAVSSWLLKKLHFCTFDSVCDSHFDVPNFGMLRTLLVQGLGCGHDGGQRFQRQRPVHQGRDLRSWRSSLHQTTTGRVCRVRVTVTGPSFPLMLLGVGNESA